MQERLLGVEQAARYLGIKPGTLYLWARIGFVPSVKMGRRLLFDIADLDAFIERKKRGAPMTDS
ncbi:MAG: DNA-binding protein [Acidobacteria bacterium]|nr:MAG: DNA-binding protein [Acidobacteriota bacterium]